MDGPFYVDQRPPFNVVSPAAVTLTTTLQALAPAGFYPVLGANYFSYVGKAVRVRAFGQLTTGATPGNFLFNHIWGPGTSNVGQGIGGVTAVMTANLTATSWISELIVRCRSVGTTGTIMTGGYWFIQGIGMFALPPNGPAPTTIDTTQNYNINLQCNRSGSTGETIQIHDYLFESLN